jgi:hypothetical protein
VVFLAHTREENKLYCTFIGLQVVFSTHTKEEKNDIAQFQAHTWFFQLMHVN